MRKLDLSEYAAIADILASVGVIISLLFVAYTIAQNSHQLQASNDNLMYQMVDSVYEPIVTNPRIAAIRVKLASEEPLSAIEEERYLYHRWRHMLVWEMAFDRYQEGMLSQEKWDSWDKAFAIEILSRPHGLPREVWGIDETFGTGFDAHVDRWYDRLIEAGDL